MKSVIFVAIFCTIIVTSLFVFRTIELHEETTNLKLGTPDEVLQQFWQYSVDGDVQSLNKIASIPNADWMSGCDVSTGAEDAELTGRLTLDRYSEVNMPGDKKQKLTEVTSEVSFSGGNISENVQIFAKYIYGSNVAWKRFRIVDRKVFRR